MDTWKQLVMAISDSRIPRVHAVLAVQCNNGGSVFSMLEMVDKAVLRAIVRSV
jgi:hypothetical protein